MEARSFRDSVDIILARCCCRWLVVRLYRFDLYATVVGGQVVSTRIKVEEEKNKSTSLKKGKKIYTSWISLHEYPQKRDQE